MQALIEYASYMPHGYCLFWQPWLVILYAGSDLLIFLAYAAIPIALLSVLRRRTDVPFNGIVVLFAAFILLCGLTHLISVVTLWIPVYPLHGMAKLATGVVSAVTAVALFRLAPTLVAIPSPSHLESVNARLREEIDAHEKTLAALRETQEGLERTVALRTEELSEANAQLKVMAGEAVHRSKNLLTVVSALARQTAQHERDSDRFLEKFLGRIAALAGASSAVEVDDARPGATTLENAIRGQMADLTSTFGDRVAIEGPDVVVRGEAARGFALAVHELTTNAIKHGALSGDEGRVDLEWEVAQSGEGREIRLVWRETTSGGSAAAQTLRPAKTERQGFGSQLLNKLVPAMLRGEAETTMTETGLVYVLRSPVAD